MNTLGRREKIMQHFELEWSPDAVDDLDEIWDSIAIDGDFDIADSFVEKLREEARTLCDNARKGRIIPEIGMDCYREHYYKGYTIVYEIMDKTILVHEVFNQKRIYIRSYPRFNRR